jgi:hypothetical protein
MNGDHSRNAEGATHNNTDRNRPLSRHWLISVLSCICPCVIEREHERPSTQYEQVVTGFSNDQYEAPELERPSLALPPMPSSPGGGVKHSIDEESSDDDFSTIAGPMQKKPPPPDFVVPGSELQKAIAMSMGGQADLGGSASPKVPECVLCFGEFNEENPEMRTLCRCGINRAHWHFACLLTWMEKDENCPVCREPLYYEEVGE